MLVGRYVVLSQLGEGGGGVVYAAYDPQLDRKIALKFLHADAGGLGVEEARALAQFSHPNVVTIYDVGRSGGRDYVAMELVDGEPLDKWRGDHGMREILRALVDAGRGLSAAHARGLIHRDVKPSNVLVDRAGRARLADFGLARDVAKVPASTDPEGTPPFISPECYAGSPPDIRSDIYSFAVTCLEACTGQEVFEGDDEASLLAAKLEMRLTRDLARALPAPLWAVLRKAISPRPEERPASVDVVVAALTAEASPRRRWRWVLLSAGVLTSAIALGVMVRGGDQTDERCADAAAREMERAMPHTRIHELSAKFAAAGGWVADLWPKIAGELDASRASWITSYRGACQSTTPEARRRLACLADRADEMAANLDAVAVAPAAALTRVRGWFGELRLSASRCASTVPPVGGPADREVAAAEWMRRAGDAKGSLARTVAVASKTDVPIATRGRAWLEASAAAGALADTVAAEAHARAAFVTAQRAGDDSTACSAALMLGDAALERAQLDAAAQWLDIAEAIADRVAPGAHDRLHANLLGERGMLASQRGDEHEMFALFRAELAMREQVFGARSAETIAPRLDLGRGLTDSGDVAGGIAMLEQALAIAETTQGPRAPDVAQVLESLGSSRASAGDPSAGIRDLERAIAITIAAYGAEHPGLATMYSNLANIYNLNRDFAHAIELQTKALVITVAHDGADHPSTAARYQALALFESAAFRLENARVHAKAALAILDHEGSDHPDLGRTVRTLANIELKAGNWEAARSYFLRSREISVKHGGPSTLDAVEAASGVGWTALKLGRPDALEVLAAAVASAEAGKLTEHLRFSVFLMRLAEAQRQAGSFGLSIATAQRARDITRDAGTLAVIDLTLVQSLAASKAPPAEVASVLSRTIEEGTRVDADLSALRGLRASHGCPDSARCTAPARRP